MRDGQLLFLLPHQIHQLPANKYESEFYKLTFDQNCLSLLPRQFPFLVNPLGDPLIQFSPEALTRVAMIFEVLTKLMQTGNAPTPLVLAHLNSLLTEFDTAYFYSHASRRVIGENLSRFIQFKLLVEQELTEQLSIQTIAEKLALNSNSLYHVVKQYAGLSPKEYITNRLILEAQRRLYYGESSIKQLAFELGFNDPEYFSRLFKRVTGRNIQAFMQEIQTVA